jgi:hypothetical protein
VTTARGIGVLAAWAVVLLVIPRDARAHPFGIASRPRGGVFGPCLGIEVGCGDRGRRMIRSARARSHALRLRMFGRRCLRHHSRRCSSPKTADRACRAQPCRRSRISAPGTPNRMIEAPTSSRAVRRILTRRWHRRGRQIQHLFG